MAVRRHNYTGESGADAYNRDTARYATAYMARFAFLAAGYSMAGRMPRWTPIANDVRGFVYAATFTPTEDCTFVKVGYTTTHPLKRISDFSRSCPVPLYPWFAVWANRSAEMQLLELLQPDYTSFNDEWFLLADDFRRRLNSAVRQMNWLRPMQHRIDPMRVAGAWDRWLVLGDEDDGCDPASLHIEVIGELTGDLTWEDEA